MKRKKSRSRWGVSREIKKQIASRKSNETTASPIPVQEELIPRAGETSTLASPVCYLDEFKDW